MVPNTTFKNKASARYKIQIRVPVTTVNTEYSRTRLPEIFEFISDLIRGIKQSGILREVISDYFYSTPQICEVFSEFF